MNDLLLDTHVLVWLIKGNPRLIPDIRSVIHEAANDDRLWVSAITPWEIGLLVAKKKIDLEMDVQAWVDKALALPGIRLQLLSPSIAVSSTRLPWEMHPDPADRILVATARHMGATLITADGQLLRYAAEGRLRCLSAV
jgi:PIN domain nuclease of toxin-antitoxin system